jgi:hypothetical protein
LAENSADPLGFCGEGQFTIELWRELRDGNAGLPEPARKLPPEVVRKNRRIEENRLNGCVLFDGAGEVSNAFDEVKAGAGAGFRGLE